MKVSDPIANLLTNLSNASKVGKNTILIPASGYKMKLLEILKTEGVISGFSRQSETPKDVIEVKINTNYTKFKRISKPGRRLYVKSSHLPRNQRHVVIVSTPKGVMTAKQAIKNHVGGEVILEVS